MDASCLTVRNLQAWYTPQQMVLSSLSMELKKHEAVGLIGWNGAGKTTLIRALSGLLKNCRADEVRSGSRPVDFRDEAFKLYRYSVFDEDHSFAYFTVSVPDIYVRYPGCPVRFRHRRILLTEFR